MILVTDYESLFMTTQNQQNSLKKSLPFYQGSKLLNFVRITNIHSIRINGSRSNCVSIGSTSPRRCRWTGVINGAVISAANRQLKRLLWRLSHQVVRIRSLNDTNVTMYVDFIANMIWENK